MWMYSTLCLRKCTMNSSLFIRLLLLISNCQGESFIDLITPKAISCLVNKQHYLWVHGIFPLLWHDQQNAKCRFESTLSPHRKSPSTHTFRPNRYSFQSSNVNRNCYEEGRKQCIFTMQFSDWLIFLSENYTKELKITERSIQLFSQRACSLRKALCKVCKVFLEKWGIEQAEFSNILLLFFALIVLRSVTNNVSPFLLESWSSCRQWNLSWYHLWHQFLMHVLSVPESVKPANHNY